MIDNNEVTLLVEKSKNLHLDDDFARYEIWDRLIMIFSNNLEDTLGYLNECSKEKIYWISEIFEQLSEKLQENKFIECIEDLQKKFPDIDLSVEIMYAKMVLKPKLE